MSGGPFILPFLLTLLCTTVTGWVRWNGDGIRKPLGLDEWISVEHYTWVRLSPSGEQFRIHRAADFEALPRPIPRQLVMGLYCSLGRWVEPNNHILNSVLMNFSLALHRDNRWARAPALRGGLAFSLLLFIACCVFTGSPSAACVVAVLGLCCPYVSSYSLEARGYSWMLALQVGLLLIGAQVARFPSSIHWGALCCFTAIVSFLNVISLGLDWVTPFYLASMLSLPALHPKGPSAGDVEPIRRNLVIQWLVVAGFAAWFIVDRLPYLYSSSRLYGTTFTNAREFAGGLARISMWLFPSYGWKALAILGVLGLGWIGAPAHWRYVRCVALSTASISLVHFLLSGRLPYPPGLARTLGNPGKM